MILECPLQLKRWYEKEYLKFPIPHTNFTVEDIAEITKGWEKTMALAHKTITANNAFNWQMLAGTSIATGQANQLNCLEYFRSSCRAPYVSQKRPLLYYATINTSHHDPNRENMLSIKQDIASFLLVRGDYAWYGTGWLGCGFAYKNGTCCSGDGTKCKNMPESGAECNAATNGFYERLPEMDMDYGIPIGNCHETIPDSSGIFTREWSNVNVSIDCRKWEADFAWKK